MTNTMQKPHPLTGYKHSTEARERMSAARRALYADPDFRDRMRAATANRPPRTHTESTREKIAAANVTTWSDPEVRAKRTAGIAAAMATPEVKARHKAALHAALADPELRARMSRIGKPKDAETRANMRAAQRRRWDAIRANPDAQPACERCGVRGAALVADEHGRACRSRRLCDRRLTAATCACKHARAQHFESEICLACDCSRFRFPHEIATPGVGDVGGSDVLNLDERYGGRVSLEAPVRDTSLTLADVI